MRFKLFPGVEPLPAQVSKLLEKVTIVGIKPAFWRLVELSRMAPGEQPLYLISDVNNRLDSEAVMLHDGVNKLGRVITKEAGAIREYLDNASLDRGQDQVIVVSLGALVKPGQSVKDAESLEVLKQKFLNQGTPWASSVCVAGIGLVYERLARKHAQHKPL